jgi:hypothetical protein
MLEETTLRTFAPGDVIQIGPFTVEQYHVCHSIPDAVGLGITTPAGLIVHSGDFKFDHAPVDGWPTDYAKLAEFSVGPRVRGGSELSAPLCPALAPENRTRLGASTLYPQAPILGTRLATAKGDRVGVSTHA